MNVLLKEVSPRGITHELQNERLVRNLLFRTNTALDNENFDEFLACCATDFNYKITTYSPEIRKNMTWFEQDRRGMTDILGTINKHNRDRNPIVRHWSIVDISAGAANNRISATSTFEIYRTELDGGVTRLYAVGRYLDEVAFTESGALLETREVRLNTRMLGTGYHIPF